MRWGGGRAQERPWIELLEEQLTQNKQNIHRSGGPSSRGFSLLLLGRFIVMLADALG